MARELERWGPTEGALISRDDDASCFSFFSVADGWFAIGRTIYGVPEYSGRGSLQVTTFFLVVRHDQFAAYESHALALAYTALALGYLRLIDLTADTLPLIDLPSFPFSAAQPIRSGKSAFEISPGKSTAGKVSPAELSQGRLAIMGARDPAATAYQLISSMPRDQRSTLSFCSGLRPSPLRPFQLHVYGKSTPALLRQLADLQIHPVNPPLHSG
jgi:hypothetical protein